MMDLAIRNYIKAFKWQNIKASYHNGGWFTLIYFLVVLPLIMAFNPKEGDASIAIYISVLFPSVFTMFTTVLYPMTLPKLMYLCPMSKEMRKDYIIKACFIRTLVPISLTLIVLSILLLRGATDWISAIGIFLNHVIFAIFWGSGTNVSGFGNIDEKGIRSIPMDSLFSLLEAAIIFFSMLISCGHAACSPVSAHPVLKLLLIGATLLFPLPATISYLKYWPSAVENALTYENCLKQPTKFKK